MKNLKKILTYLILTLLTTSHLTKKDLKLKTYKTLLKNIITGKTSIKSIKTEYKRQKASLKKKRNLLINPMQPFGMGKKGDNGAAIAGWITAGTGLALGGYGIYKMRKNQTDLIQKLNLIKSNKQRALLEMENDKENKMSVLKNKIATLSAENNRMFEDLKMDIENLMNEEVEEGDHEVEREKEKEDERDEGDRLLRKAERIMLEKLKREKMLKKKEKKDKLI